MAPRYWKVTVEGQPMTVVAGTREAAEKIAARRLAQSRRPRLTRVGRGRA
jgi:hypothetical protein